MRIFTISIFYLLVTSASMAFAHAHVESSNPKKGDILMASPENVSITFSEELLLKESSIKVLDIAKKQVNSAKITASKDNETLTAQLPKLMPGTYTVKWKAVCLCADHHATNGKYTFTVK